MNKDLYSMKKNGCEDIRARSYNRHKKYVKKKKKATRSGRGKDGRRCWLYGLRQMQHTHPRVQIVAIYGQGISPPQSALSPIHLHAESRSAVAFVHQWSWRSLMARNGTSSYLTRLCFPSFSAAPFFFFHDILSLLSHWRLSAVCYIHDSVATTMLPAWLDRLDLQYTFKETSFSRTHFQKRFWKNGISSKVQPCIIFLPFL